MYFFEVMTVPLILFLTIALPLWLVFHYVTKWKQMSQAGAGDGILTQMHNMPVSDRTLAGGVLAHGGQHDAIGQVHAAQGNGRKKLASHESPQNCQVILAPGAGA